ncbi:F-box protein SKIP24 [Coffea eugenioides]|uniref:F-box protein SKIP24 n=1 Tax=Coffea eugenioides TaxID=49369 RepID=UPI000F60B518|nr:F-box protein SKIP24 [Coffea eugenioides]
MGWWMLPDELWRRILELGATSASASASNPPPCRLTYRDLCCLSITCRRLHRLSSEDSLWSSLLLSDFPPPPSNASFNSTSASSSSSSSSSLKALYKIRYERGREQKRLAHRRIILRIESEVAESSRKIREMELHLAQEREKMRITVAELLNLRRVRQASAALKVWQPEVVRGTQKQMVEQCNVPVESRISALEMELRLCKQQIANYDKALKVENRKVDRAKEQLESVKYHPLHDFSRKGNRNDKHGIRRKRSKHA